MLTAGVYQKSFRHLHAQLPFFRRHSACGKKPSRGQQFGTPPFRRKKKCLAGKTQGCLTRGRRQVFDGEMQSMARRRRPRLGERDERVSRMFRRNSGCDYGLIPSGLRLLEMKTPPSRQPQLQFVDRPVAGIFQQILRLHSNAWLRSRDELYADLLFLDGVARAERRNTPACQRGQSRRHHNKPTRMNLNAQSNLIVSGKSQKQKECTFFGKPPRRVNASRCRLARQISIRRRSPVSEKCGKFELATPLYLRRPRTRWNPVPE